jgi:4-hydroxy-tetrahydrodipicolinate synthase
LVRYALKGDFSKAKALHYQILPLMHAVFREGSPAGIKYVLRTMGLCEDHLRLPLVGISDRLQEEIKHLRQQWPEQA